MTDADLIALALAEVERLSAGENLMAAVLMRELCGRLGERVGAAGAKEPDAGSPPRGPTIASLKEINRTFGRAVAARKRTAKSAGEEAQS